MKKTFVTNLPDKSGAFLKASECFYNLGLNIVRVSYNKAVDTHTLFIEVDGDGTLLQKASLELEKIGYIAKLNNESNVILIDVKLDDTTGDLVKLLKLISEYDFNISYIDTHEKEHSVQNFRLALFVDSIENFTKFFKTAKELFPISIVEYDQAKTNYDNSIFYHSFVDNIAKNARLDDELKGRLAVNVNRIMQNLDAKNVHPKDTFEIIKKFADHLVKYRGDNFTARITTYKITENSSITVIEPPCGSNMTILESKGEYLFVDTGFAIYEQETLKIIKSIVKNFDDITKKVIVTHADVDHTGLLHLFDEIYVSEQTKQCFELESKSKRGFREQNPLHLPYVRICKLLSFYNPPPLDKLKVIGCMCEDNLSPLCLANKFKFNEFEFDVYVGQGGHVPGELILIDKKNKVAFSGDIFVNIKGYTDEQLEYNKYAPMLMTSVDTNKELAKIERNAFIKLLDGENYKIFSGHGQMKELE